MPKWQAMARTVNTHQHLENKLNLWLVKFMYLCMYVYIYLVYVYVHFVFMSRIHIFTYLWLNTYVSLKSKRKIFHKISIIITPL